MMRVIFISILINLLIGREVKAQDYIEFENYAIFMGHDWAVDGLTLNVSHEEFYYEIFEFGYFNYDDSLLPAYELYEASIEGVQFYESEGNENLLRFGSFLNSL